MGDEVFACVECGRTFVWSYGEQRYYSEHGLATPKRCPDCRSRRRAARITSTNIVAPHAHANRIEHEPMHLRFGKQGAASRYRLAIYFGVFLFILVIVVVTILLLKG